MAEEDRTQMRNEISQEVRYDSWVTFSVATCVRAVRQGGRPSLQTHLLWHGAKNRASLTLAQAQSLTQYRYMGRVSLSPNFFCCRTCCSVHYTATASPVHRRAIFATLVEI